MLYVHGAVYENSETLVRGELVGINRAQVFIKSITGELLPIPKDIFEAVWLDTGLHDHEEYCCDVHETHARSMHKGCALR